MHNKLPPTNPDRPFASALVLLGLLIAVDLLFIAAHVLHVWTPWLRYGGLSIETDGGMAEQYQYVKLIWLSICMLLAFWQSRMKFYLGWMLLFGVLLLDDALRLHEQAGTVIAQGLGLAPAFGLRAKDFGEILFAAGIGGIAAALVAFTFWRGAPASKQVSADILFLLCILGFFGVFFDALHTIAYFKAPALAALFTLIEDGGEMLVISVLTAYAFDIASNSGTQRFAIWQHLRPRRSAVPAANTVV